MKLWLQKTSEYLRGIAPPGGGLLLFVFEELITLCRQKGESYKLIASQPVDLHDHDGLRDAFRALFATPLYLGQPVHLIPACDHLATSYIRKAQDLSSSQIFDIVQSLSGESSDSRIGFLQQNDRRILFVQTLRREPITFLQNLLSELSVPLLSVISLPVFEYHAARTRASSDKCVTLVRLPANRAMIMAWVGDGLVYDYYELRKDDTSLILEFSRTYLDKEKPYDTAHIDHRYETTGKGFSLPRLGKEPKELFLHVNSRRLATTIRTVWNSLYAVFIVLVGACVLLGAILSAYRLALPRNDASIDSYQALYNEQSSLSMSVDSLEGVFTSIGSPDGTVSASAILSAFCQVGRGDLYLNSISVVPDAADETIRNVTAIGTARNEAAVFAYHKATEPFLNPFALTLDLVTPSIISNAGRPDTVVQFRLRSTIAP